MTASNDHNTTKENSEQQKLPTSWELLRATIVFTQHYASDIYGFAAYLLFPMILIFGTQAVGGTLGEVINASANVLFIFITCWIQATLIIFTQMRLGHPKKDPDSRSIALFATTTLSVLVLTGILSGIIQFAGFLLLIIPGIILNILFTFSPEEVVLRGSGPLSALAASRAKVQPRFFAILWRILGLSLGTFGVYILVMILAFFTVSAITATPITELFTFTPPWLDAILTLLQIGFLPLFFIGHTLLFLSLEEPKEESPS